MFHRNLKYIVLSGIIMVPGLLMAQPPGRGGPQGGMQGGPPPMEMIFQIFQQADANRDGSVTKAELTAAMQTHARAGRPGRGGPPPQQQNQARGNQRRPGGPPPRPENQADHPRPEHGEHGHQGPPPEPGQVLPEPIADSLNLNAKQTRDLAALQADVDKRLADILTDEQKEQLENPRPPHGPGQVEGERGERPAGRPQRRQRPE